MNWCESVSKTISVCNSVKQVGILSPILFSVYMDILLTKLEESKIGNKFCGALGYADDVALCPSLSSLKMMLSIADKFGKEFDISFNSIYCLWR